MTPDTAIVLIEESKAAQPPSTAGMTTKVVKGSIWTLAGSALPLAVSFISTPFIIRFLGAESYGVLLLVGLIPTYFTFADFGMGVASTKFAAEAFGQGDREKEREIVWTATMVAAISSLVVAIPIFVFSYAIVVALNVPEHLLTTASVALKITSAAFVFGVIASVLNSPMLARLRMDLNTVTQAVPRILLAAVTPFILYFGGGIVGAVSWAFIIGVATFAVVFYFSGRLLPGLYRPVFSRELLKPLFRVGGALAMSGIAAVLLANLEKLILTRVTSVETLAYYSVASTLAGVAIMFGLAMHQSLVPAFAQLLEPDKRDEMKTLFSRTVRMNIIGMAPLFASFFVIAGPFFTIWAGPEFGRESTQPFHIIIVASLFSLWTFVPVSVLLAKGRMDVLAKVYWIELVPYIALTAFLTYRFGAVGAAIAWSVRVLIDTCIMAYFGTRISGLSIWVFKAQTAQLAVCLLILAVPAAFAATTDQVLNLSLALLPIALIVYALVAWKTLLHSDERGWVISKYNALRSTISFGG